MPIDPIIGGALIGGASKLLGSIFGSSNNNSTNKTNLRIAQMNNEYNERMFDKQIQYNWDMWNANNDYNSAASQFKRYEEAGLNPFIAMQGQNAGTATSTGSVSPPTAQSVQMQSYDPSASFNSLGDSLQNAFIQGSVAREEIRGKQLENQHQEIENKYFEARLLKELAGMDKGNKRQDIENHILGIDAWIKDQSKDDMAQRAGFENAHIQAQVGYIASQKAIVETQNSLAKFELNAAPMRLKMELAETSARISSLLAAGQLSLEQAKTQATVRAVNLAQSYKTKIEATTMAKCMKSVIEKTYWDMKGSKRNALAPYSALGNSAADMWNTFIKGYNNTFGNIFGKGKQFLE